MRPGWSDAHDPNYANYPYDSNDTNYSNYTNNAYDPNNTDDSDSTDASADLHSYLQSHSGFLLDGFSPLHLQRSLLSE